MDGGQQLLTLRRLSPREPPEPMACARAQLGPSNTELGTGELRVRAAITVSLRVQAWSEHDGLLLIYAVSADGVVTGVVLMISQSYSHRAPLSRDLLIRSYWRAPARLIEIQRRPHVGGG